ncbi:tyrosine-type recombinase/integrase [Sphingobium phenoxybenzoativorans]|uniref:tyrosine-type recombinase/integrase n=1 Tax=Sphingobium phenoxybenzoativorans TaxID=1592790 RepID=UPI000AD64013|nr:integrase arm-type DNA-binding domain-containing protein [Sphingobium phenoxybenzoativorans]
MYRKMLTDKAVRAAKAKEKAYKMADGHGLYLLVHPNGSRYWRMDYKHADKRATLSLGIYPEVSLKEVRLAQTKARDLLAQGINPSSYKKLTRGVGSLSAGDSFKAVADEWVAKLEAEGRAAGTIEKMRWMLGLAEPLLGTRPIGQIKPAELLTVLRTVEARGRYETARRLRSTCGSIFRYAIATGRAQRDISVDLLGALITPKVTHRAAIVEPVKVGQLLREIEGYEGQPVVEAALRLAPHVFVRPGELRMAEWSEFDLEEAVWTIGPAKMKMRRPHRVPLSSQVISLVRRLKPMSGTSKYLFPSVRTPDRCISENTVNAALRRIGYDKTEMTGHGFRAMASTLLNESGQWHPDAIERQLAHVENNDVRRAYLRGEHWDERVRMMQAWSDYLDQLRDGAKILSGNFRQA